MSDRAFLDTHVIVHLFDGRVPEKQRAAGRLLQTLADEGSVPVISTQVLQEAYSALTRKLKLDPREALTTLQMMQTASFRIENVAAEIIWRGAALSVQDQIPFRDAMIVETARTAQCGLLYSEDLQDGRVFETVVVRNPFNGRELETPGSSKTRAERLQATERGIRGRISRFRAGNSVSRDELHERGKS